MTEPELQARAEAARRAVRSQIDFFDANFGRVESSWKKDGTRVTAADVAISENLFALLRAQFPGDLFLSEELSDPGGPIPLDSRFAWILDPIDGTNNFALGIPHCAISLGLFDRGRPAYGAIYDHNRRALMHGGPGFGAWDGERPCRAIDREPVRETLIGFHSPLDKSRVPAAKAIIEHFKIRGLGSATLHLAYVAAGILDGTIDYNVKIWDLAAALALCGPAGVEVRFLDREILPLRSFDLDMPRIVYAAAAPRLCARLAELMG